MDQIVPDTDEGPLYQRVFNTLREEILSGLYDAESVLPSEKQLEERFGVSRITIRRAVQELEGAGLAERAKGRVTRLPERRAPILADVDDELANMLAAVSDLETSVHHFRWLAANKELADTLQIPRGEKILWIVRSRARKGQPVMHSVLYLPLWAGQGLSRDDLVSKPIVELVRQRGIRLASGEQTMSAAPCPEDVAPRLGLAPGDPVFFIRRLIRDANDRPVLFNDVCFRWDSFVYSMALEPGRPRVREADRGQVLGDGLRMLPG